MIDLRAGLAGLAVAALLAGCSDSGGDGDASGFDALEETADSLLNEVQDLAFTDPATLPTSGAATFQGVVGLDLDSVPDDTLQGKDMAGELELTVNFAGAGDPVTGTASGFRGVDDEDFDGTLVVSGGALDRDADPETGSTLSAGMAGVLTGEDGTAWTIETELGGNFAGSDHSHVFGDVVGTGCTGGTCTAVEGGFVGER